MKPTIATTAETPAAITAGPIHVVSGGGVAISPSLCPSCYSIRHELRLREGIHRRPER